MKIRREKQTFRKVKVIFAPKEQKQLMDQFGDYQWIKIKPRMDLRPWGTREVLLWEPVK